MVRQAIGLLFITISVARPVVYTGTVIYADLSQGLLTIAADSRSTLSTGEHDDTECKISAFGDHFVFAMAGLAKWSGTNRWDAHEIAHDVFLSDPSAAVASIAAHWAVLIDEEKYKSPIILQTITSNTILANAIFAKDDVSSGHLIVYTINIQAMYGPDRRVTIWHDPPTPVDRGRITAGRDEIIDEFFDETSERAKDYMRMLRKRVSGLPHDQMVAEFSKSMIQISIQFHPLRNELAPPIDVLQVIPQRGITWISRKQNCPEK